MKINNIEAARNLLDVMYNQIGVDEVASIMRNGSAGEIEGDSRSRFLFTVKIVQAEGLDPNDSLTLDTFVTLSDERGHRSKSHLLSDLRAWLICQFSVAKTRTIYESLDPRWEQAFDISVEGSMWIAATIWDRTLIGDHKLVGRAYLRLDPRSFGDFMAHDLWLGLDGIQGRIQVRVSMEGEKDDVQFYFGRAFRSLKRAEGDMTRIIVDKVSLLIMAPD